MIRERQKPRFATLYEYAPFFGALSFLESVRTGDFLSAQWTEECHQVTRATSRTWVLTEPIGISYASKGVLRTGQPIGLLIKSSQIVVHPAHPRNSVADRLDAESLSGKQGA